MFTKPHAATASERPLELIHPVAETYRRLRSAGLTAREAGTLVGRRTGLPMTPGGWAIAEVERLLFVRALVSVGRMGS